MKRYIRHFDEKHWYNFLLEGKVFFWQKKLGIYAMKKSPTVYLKEFGKNVKMISLLKDDLNEVELLKEKNLLYYELRPKEVLKITYIDGSAHRVTIVYNTALHSYFYH